MTGLDFKNHLIVRSQKLIVNLVIDFFITLTVYFICN